MTSQNSDLQASEAPLASQSISSLYSEKDAETLLEKVNQDELKKLNTEEKTTTVTNEKSETLEVKGDGGGENGEPKTTTTSEEGGGGAKETSNTTQRFAKKEKAGKLAKTSKRASLAPAISGNTSDELTDSSHPPNHHHTHRHFSLTGSLLSQHQREQWSKKFDFLMSIIGFSVDLASIWRFPYLCFKNGGGAFLIPYTIMIFLLGLPLFFMELALGQYNKCGAITCWKKICPLLSGVGYAVVLIAFYTDFFYNVIISWGVYYLFGSFSKKLPWGSCGNSWNSEHCYEISSLLKENKTRLETPPILIQNLSNMTNISIADDLTINSSELLISSSEEYFFKRMYEFSDNLGMDNFGSILYENVFCLFVIYIVCYFSMWKGVQTSGKVVWVTALLPYVVLIILAARALFLSGSARGLEYYLTPNMTYLKNPMVWMDAASQVFFSLGPGFGVLLAFSSYNKFDNNIYKDAIITVFVNYLSSFVSGAVIFMYLGYMSEVAHKPIQEVAKEGSSLVFIVYPEAISILPIPQFWSVIFFLMLITLGLDSSFGGSEAIITALADEYPILRKRREIFVGALFSFYMIIGLPSCTQAGYYLVEFLNNYSAVYSILFAVLIENIAVAWLYGTKRFCDDIYEMIDYYPGRFWCYCWKYITPVCVAFVLCMGIYAYIPLEIGRTGSIYRYPDWANASGWLVAASSCICIPIVAIYQLIIAKGTFMQRLRATIRPHRDRTPLDIQIKIELEHQNQPTA